MAVRIESNVEPIPGYRLIERIGGGGFGEVWKCEAPGGLHKAIKFVFGTLETAGDAGQRAEQELKALSRVKTVRHPYILSLERYDIIDGQLIIIMELADRNLWDRYRECRNQGLTGIPRDELLGYMEEAAEALDLMNGQYQLQHLDIKPQNLFLVHQHIKVADFGLVKDLEGSQASVTGGITPVYAAPETFDGRVTRFSDQYSLAIVCQELLTGQRPFRGNNVRQLILQHMQSEPNLTPLEESDRPIIGRALRKVPEERYPTCGEFVRALRDAGRRAREAGAIPGDAPTVPRGEAEVTPPDSEGLAGLEREARGAAPPLSPPGPSSRQEHDNSAPTHYIGAPGASRPVSGLVPASQPFETPPSPAPDTDHGGALFPALIIGLGGIGAQVLQAFRTLLGERFGSPDILQQVRLLLIDTDADVLKLGGLPPTQAGRPKDAPPSPFPLTSAEMLLAPLNRPSHYLRPKSGRAPIDAWLNQRMIYRIPREQVTTGVRALGRLALFDNVQAVQRRLQQELMLGCDLNALEQAARATGLGVRSYRPRVIIVSGLMGGTGSGMFLDVAYLVRVLLRQLGHADPEVNGVLFVPRVERRGSHHPTHKKGAKETPPRRSTHHGPGSARGGAAAEAAQASRTLAMGNTCAALVELLHYSRPKTTFQVRYLEREPALSDSSPPFTSTVLLTLPEGPHRRESQETIGMTARWLLGECASSFGRWRGSNSAASRMGTYRTFGLYRVSFPSAPVIRYVATRCLKKIVERWMSKDARPLVDNVREWVAERWRGDELGPEHFIARVKEACEKRLGKDPERAFQASMELLTGKFGPDEILDTLVRFEQLLGRPQVTNEGGQFRSTDWGPASLGAVEVTGAPHGMPELSVKLAGQREVPRGSLVTVLGETAVAIATEWSQKLAELPVKLIEKPDFRLPGAEEAIRQVVETIEQVLERHEPLGRELADRSADAYGRLLSLVHSLGEARSWPRRGPTPEGAVELMRTYAKARYQSLVLQQVLGVYVSLRGVLSDELREINFCRARLQDLLTHLGSGEPEGTAPLLPASTEGRVKHLFPGGSDDPRKTIDALAGSMTPADLLELDARLQKMIRETFVALVDVCMARKNQTKELALAMRQVGADFVAERIGPAEATRMLLEGSGKDAAGEQLLTCYEEAVPDPAESAAARALHPPAERVVVGAPIGEAGDVLRALAEERLVDSALTLATCESDLVVYREWSDLPLLDVDPLGPAGREAYQSLTATEHFTPHSRQDVTFELPR